MTIDEIYRNKKISVRSYNLCRNNEFHSVSDLHAYYQKHKSFENLQNCGKKSNHELIEICTQTPDFKIEEVKEQEEKHLKTIVSELTRTQREVINSFILVNTNSLSVRSKNAISLHLKGNFKIKKISEEIFLNENFNVRTIKNIGRKSIPELEIYIEILKDFLFEVSESTDEKHLIALKNGFLLQRTFSISKIPSSILETESIFLLADFLLNQNALFDEAQTIIVKKALKIYQNQKESTLDDIAAEVNLTRERIRQIRKICLNELFDELSFIQNFNDDLLQKYSIDAYSNQIDIDSNIANNINLINNINLSREFITYIIFVYLNGDFSLVGNIEDVLQTKYSNTKKRYNWNNFYLVKKEIANEIDFNALTNDINRRSSDKIEETYSFNFKSYLSKFLVKNNIDILDLVFPIAEKIVNDEFELYLDLDENLIFKRNKNKLAHEYSNEALEELGKPSNVSDICKKIIELHPNYITDEDKVRSSMKRANGFVPIGRKSVFGLKKWERELDNFKGGTIKDVIIEFLQYQNEPTHILSVLEYLDKFRKNKGARSVLTNLKLDPMKRFLLYNQGFIGLQSKANQYGDKFKKLPVQLGKTIIAKHKKGYSLNDIKMFLRNSYDLTFEESKLILDNLKYFNEN